MLDAQGNPVLGQAVTFTTYGAALNVSYTLDAFGGIRRQIEQLGAQADYQRFELEATDLTLAANVVTRPRVDGTAWLPVCAKRNAPVP